MNFFNGYKVVITQEIPRFVLSAKVPVTEEFRREFNDWAREFFGFEKPHPPMVSERFNTILLCRDDWEVLKRSMQG